MNLVNAVHLSEMVDVTGIEPATPLASPSFRAVFYARGLDNVVSVVVSCVWMKREEAIKARGQLVRRLPDASEILRGSLLHRKIFHRQGCPKCRRGEGHRVWVLTVSYPGGRTRQFSIRAEQKPQVEKWLENYQQLSQTGSHLRGESRIVAGQAVV